MASAYYYKQVVRNEYLGKRRVVRATNSAELDWLVEAQIAKWCEEERRTRQRRAKEAQRRTDREHTDNLKGQAEEDTKTAQETLSACKQILDSSLTTTSPLVWDGLLIRATYPPFPPDYPRTPVHAVPASRLGEPPLQRELRRPVHPPPNWWEWLLRSWREAREKRERAVEARYRAAVDGAAADFSAALKTYRARYDADRAAVLDHQKAHNDAVRDLWSRFEAGQAEAIEQYLRMNLERSSYPECVPNEFDVRFDAPSRTAVISFWLPGPSDLPRIVEYKFVASRKAINTVLMKDKEFNAFYDETIHQIALRVAHEAFVADYRGWFGAVVFNGWVRGTDTKTGKEFTSCILSYEAPRDRFTDLNLAQVIPRDCIRGLKGVTAGPLALLGPVKPVMELDRTDDRFVESKEVLGQLAAGDNLAAMEWEDFEHLVRELFEKEFAATGGEVRVTQASRDRGVDAIAFDPDPIRGGKVHHPGQALQRGRTSLGRPRPVRHDD